jgi:hypothetical protein
MSTYTPIASQTLGSAASSVTFSSIPQGYSDLVFVVNSNEFSSGASLGLQFNGDAGGNYSYTFMYGDGTNSGSQRAANTSSCYVGQINGGTIALININNYSNTTTYKTVLTRNGASSQSVFSGVSLWRNTNAITSLTISRGGNFASGSTFSIYGIAGGGYTAKAAGGIVTTDGTYAYHTFTTSGAFFPYENLNADYLVVSGGGAGGRQVGGGGGGGGVRCTVGSTGGGGSLESPLAVIAGRTYPVLVGAGASAAGGGNIPNASDSSFGSIITLGGGSANSGNNGKSGGSGSGGSGGNMIQTTGGAGTAGQGFAGGTSIYGGSGDNQFGAGGGGAGAVGTNGGPGGYPGNGGNGVTTSISGTSVTYGGGGGGGSNDDSNRPYGTGGTGGGGRGGAQSTGNQAVAGTAFLGGAGGGAGGGNAYGASGGSGIVIIRYAL